MYIDTELVAPTYNVHPYVSPTHLGKDVSIIHGTVQLVPFPEKPRETNQQRRKEPEDTAGAGNRTARLRQQRWRPKLRLHHPLLFLHLLQTNGKPERTRG